MVDLTVDVEQPARQEERGVAFSMNIHEAKELSKHIYCLLNARKGVCKDASYFEVLKFLKKVDDTIVDGLNLSFEEMVDRESMLQESLQDKHDTLKEFKKTLQYKRLEIFDRQEELKKWLVDLASDENAELPSTKLEVKYDGTKFNVRSLY